MGLPKQGLNAESGLTLMTSPFSFGVFLGHSHGSIDNAVAQRLRRDGLPVWPDAWELRPGDCIPANIAGRNRGKRKHFVTIHRGSAEADAQRSEHKL